MSETQNLSLYTRDETEHGKKYYLADDVDAMLGRLEQQAGPVPEGWKLVPVEPTDKMVQAAYRIDLSYMPGQDGADRAAVYRAMLAAAPVAQAEQPPQQEPAFVMRKMEFDDGRQGWFLDAPDFYCDLQPDSKGKWSIFFRERATQEEAYAEQQVQQDPRIAELEETVRQLNQALREATEAPTFMGEPVQQRLTDEQTLDVMGQRIGYGRIQQIAGQLWDARHGCAPRGSMGVTVKDTAPPQRQPLTDEQTRTESPDDLRAAGWAVAIHNDYRLNGVAHTFWGFTKGDIFVKGEGKTDAEALEQVRSGVDAMDAMFDTLREKNAAHGITRNGGEA